MRLKEFEWDNGNVVHIELGHGIRPEEAEEVFAVRIMKKKAAKKETTNEEYYDTHGVLKDIIDEDIDLSLKDALREDIMAGKRKRRLRNVSIKIDPLYLQSIKKIATMKGIPYQTLVRQWLTEKIKRELKIA